MGVCQDKSVQKQILLCGLDGSGKTTLLYSLVLNNIKDFEPETTIGFNFEVIKEQEEKIGVWDVGGKDTIRSIWPQFYKNININGIIFVVDANDTDRFTEARQELHKLLNEEELRSAILLVIFNIKTLDDKLQQDLTEDQEKEFKELLENKLGFEFIHQLIVKKSVMMNIMKTDRQTKKIKAELKSWLLEQMEID